MSRAYGGARDVWRGQAGLPGVMLPCVCSLLTAEAHWRRDAADRLSRCCPPLLTGIKKYSRFNAVREYIELHYYCMSSTLVLHVQSQFISCLLIMVQYFVIFFKLVKLVQEFSSMLLPTRPECLPTIILRISVHSKISCTKINVKLNGRMLWQTIVIIYGCKRCGAVY